MKTTKEIADQNIHDNLVNNLQGLLEKNYDAEKGYTKAMKEVKNEQLKEFLKIQASKRAQFATELDKKIRNLNEAPQATGTVKGDLHRSWMDVKSLLSQNTDESILEECIRGEKASLEEYKETLENNRFPQEVKQTITDQMSNIQASLTMVKSLESVVS
ncbi:ferritin-like domain-containing protein [Patiriisocius hiemis]|uniref:PA2169 family four-helix-bundle protein n=1 Tax=Patiriisocius hiemis TaxID=3075604 RepID=A0ABU2YA36_9FLAO|nr:PA2169 family four-helix-bundle protein [Constantimarinum sp. W242]MDT0554489.1 PA2169 family four-helix-bundle protein [Constantimarinum sp. W242]